MSKAISGLPIAETLTGDELLPVVQDGNTVQSTVAQMVTLVGNTTLWGDIQGTLSNQTDLQTVLNLKVPYTGATTNVNLGEYGLTSGYFQADLTPSSSSAVGRLIWNDTFGTFDMGLKGGNVVLHLGQKQVILVVNKTGATLTGSDYSVVKISGAQGQRPKVALAQANNDANSADTIGLVNETIANNQEGFVCTSGTITNINTTGSMQGETWADGDVLYLSGTTAGRVTNVKPQAPIHTVIVGFVIHAHINQGKIYVKIDNGYELNELHNVKINGVTNGQVLTYNNGLWENQTNGSGTVTSVAASAGTGISVSGSPITSSGTLTITNTAPDQVVSLTAGSNVTVTGTYPNFTIAATGGGGGSGTVTDVSVVSANGFSGSVATSTTTPAITLSTSISGLLKGSSGALAAASATDVPDLPQSKITNLVTDLSAKAPLASPTFTGTPSLPTGTVGVTQAVDTNTTALATTAFVIGQGYAKLASPALTGTPTAPTASVGTNTTQVATTAFVQAEIANDAVLLTGDQTIAGTKTFSSTISGSITGNAGTVTDGVYTTGNQTIGGTKTFSSTISGSISGNAGTVTDGVYTTGDQTIAGVKTFSGTSTIVNGNLGIGVSPSYKLDLSTAGTSVARFTGPANGFTDFTNGTGTLRVQILSNVPHIGSFTNHNLNLVTNNTVKARIDTTGNFGLGVTPSAWGNGVSAQGDAWSISTTSGFDSLAIAANARQTAYGTGAQNWVYRGTARCSNYEQTNGNHIWRYAASGTAGNAVTFTTGMTLSNAGALSVNGTIDGTIFRDVSNTAFYLDPAETGISLNVAGRAVIGAGSTVDGIFIGYRDVPVATQNATYTFALTDAGKSVGKDNATAYTYTIPANASVAFPVGTVITVFNNNATNNITIAITTDTLRLAGTTSTGSRTVAPFGLCTLFKVSSTVWMASGSGVS